MAGASYARSGVDIAKVREIQGSVAKILAGTFSARRGRLGEVLLPIGHYAGLIDLGGGRALALHTDGVGSKVIVAQLMGRFDTIGIDCVAMTVNDLICLGCEPLALVDYVALEREDHGLAEELARGLKVGAKKAAVAIVGGETAILGDVIKGAAGTGFDLAAMGVGQVEKSKLVDGSKVEAGDVVVGVGSSGLHSNGYSLARKVLLKRHSVHDRLPSLSGELGAAMLTPTAIYVRPALEALARFEVHGIAHITGGAFSKLSRLVGRRRLRFELDRPPSAPIFDLVQSEGGISDREMYRTFNMGIGLCLCVPESEAEGVIRTFSRRSHPAMKVGRITVGTGVSVGGISVAESSGG